jgi:hypothetical protein
MGIHDAVVAASTDLQGALLVDKNGKVMGMIIGMAPLLARRYRRPGLPERICGKWAPTADLCATEERTDPAAANCANRRDHPYC